MPRQEFEPHLDGFYFPVEFGDTYSLQVACSDVYEHAGTQKKNNEPQAIVSLRDIKQIVVSHDRHCTKPEIDADKYGTIGQTWLAWGQLAHVPTDAKQVALECYKQVTPNPNWKPNLKESGSLLGATVFEYWHNPLIPIQNSSI